MELCIIARYSYETIEGALPTHPIKSDSSYLFRAINEIQHFVCDICISIEYIIDCYHLHLSDFLIIIKFSRERSNDLIPFNLLLIISFAVKSNC